MATRGGRTWDRVRRGTRLAFAFVWAETLAAVFPIAVFLGLAVTSVVDLPIARYDALLIWCIAVTVALWAAGWESGREVAVVAGFHLLGLALEIFKVEQGSWSYPDEGVAVVGGVPLFAGFMYASIGSYICQSWRRFDLRVTGYRPLTLAALAVLTYANFYTHHVLPDVRVPLAVVALIALGPAQIHLSVSRERFRMPLTLAFIMIGAAIWVAENVGTLLGGWEYPNQAEAWTPVHTGKIGSWTMLVGLSFALIAAVKSYEGRLYGHPGDHASVEALAHRAPAIARTRKAEAITLE